MSRRFSQTQRPRVIITSDNPYQATTQQSFPHPHCYNQKTTAQHDHEDNRLFTTNLYRNGPRPLNVAPSETCLSDDTFTETYSHYEYYHDHGYHTGNAKNLRNTDCLYSDDSDNSRLPYYEYEDISVKRQSRNTCSDRSYGKRIQEHNHVKDVRKVYPNNQENNACFVDGNQRFLNEVTNVVPRRPPALSRASDRPQSAQSSSITSSVVHGCGGRCQTFENVCYYFLQVAFTMGILIGTSLSIAGAVLRKSAARNLQVLVYIGAMLSLVSALLLSIQCSAKYSARKRKKALKNAKRAPILLEQLPVRTPATEHQQQQPLMERQRALPITIIPVTHQVQRSSDVPHIVEQPGVPWWRRKDLELLKR